ncbi:unnamed protein product [Paramecium primaurelia]|uniref:Uncharacterized protein n=1 Tax=Paramecium primaurelia TaxID=5886 RepID=A0A8S1KWS9_PARPR|nr:unnamed protein product [Paramecium primaurelia]
MNQKYIIFCLNFRYLIQNLNINIRQLQTKLCCSQGCSVSYQYEQKSVQYRFTPQVETAYLLQELKQYFILVYKDYLKQKIRQMTIYYTWLQMFCKCSTFLHELIIERNQRFDKQIIFQIYIYLPYINRNIFNRCYILQIKNNFNKVKVQQLL